MPQLHRSDTDPIARKLRLPLALTRIGMVAERALRGFWPLLTVLLLTLAALMLGLHDLLAVEIVWASAVVAVLCGIAALVYGVRAFRWPSRMEALARLDASLPGRPIQALMDRQAIGAGDAASAAAQERRYGR